MKISSPCEQGSKETGNLLDSPIKSGNDKRGASLEICVIIYQPNDAGFRIKYLPYIRLPVANCREIDGSISQVMMPSEGPILKGYSMRRQNQVFISIGFAKMQKVAI